MIISFIFLSTFILPLPKVRCNYLVMDEKKYHMDSCFDFRENSLYLKQYTNPKYIRKYIFICIINVGIPKGQTVTGCTIYILICTQKNQINTLVESNLLQQQEICNTCNLNS